MDDFIEASATSDFVRLNPPQNLIRGFLNVDQWSLMHLDFCQLNPHLVDHLLGRLVASEVQCAKSQRPGALVLANVYLLKPRRALDLDYSDQA